ncbi:lipoprotein signal peptidase [Jeotgalicoccus pinnipedialis]|nr:lipoprotein signal peptidase [Jeotgalicoccus pinnipedialis]
MIYELLNLFVAPIIVGVILLVIERYLNTHHNK